MTNSLVRVNDTRNGDRIVAITGSTKSKNLQERTGEIIGYTSRSITPTHYVLEAIVRLENGEEITTSRLKSA